MNLPQIESTNEFIAACSEVEIPMFLNIVGGLMDELKFLHPEKYKAVMNQLKKAQIPRVDTRS